MQLVVCTLGTGILKFQENSKVCVCACLYIHIRVYGHMSPGVTGNLVPQEIWHPRTEFPRKYGTPLGNLVPPCKVRKCCILGAEYPSQCDSRKLVKDVSKSPSTEQQIVDKQ